METDVATLQKEVVLLRKNILDLHKSNSELHKNNTSQKQTIADLQTQLNWFKTQLFGAKSERRVIESDSASRQLSLKGFPLETPDLPPAPEVTVKQYEREQRKDNKIKLTTSESRLKFSPEVPVEEIHLVNPATAGLTDNEYTIISHKEKYELCARATQYFIKKYIQPVVKLNSNNKVFSTPAPAAVIEKSYASSSFLSSLLVNKFKYHLPLYRQHQQLETAGINVSRGSLSRLVHRASQLLEPIHKAILSSVLTSKVLAVDETKLKVGKSGKSKMHLGYLVPMYGDKDEVVFHYSSTRSLKVVDTMLADYSGVLLTDGYEYYNNLSKRANSITHALCWSHARRKFIEAENRQPEIVNEILNYIKQLYEVEKICKGKPPPEIRELRQKYSKPLVDTLFKFYKDKLNSMTLVPSCVFTKALKYSIARMDGLRVFLDNPAVQIDTNHLERIIRPTAVGRKNWLFCMNDVGATSVAIISSIVRTCELHQVNPFDYFCDILHRIDSHPAREVGELTPRIWKQKFQ